MIERSKLDFSIEKQILVNLILNSDYCAKVLPVLEKEYFKSRSAGFIIRWVREYYNSYSTAPKQHINDIYTDKVRSLENEEREQIEAVLNHISDIAETENNNTQYLIDTAFTFCKQKLLEIQIVAAQKHLSDGNFDLAEEALSKRFELREKITNAVAWNDQNLINETVQYLAKNNEDDNVFFKFPGRLGTFIGPLERAWFVAFIAPSKRGKTIYMVESIITAIQRGLNVVFFSLEMPTKQIFARVLKNVVGNKPSIKGYTVMSPIFDCELNQKGECAKTERTGFGSLLQGGIKVSFNEAPDWNVCTACRGTSEFIPCGWEIPIEKEALNEVEYTKRVNAFMRLYGKRCRTIFYPSKTATTVDITNDLDALEHNENFIADVVVIDYADLIKPQRNAEKRHTLDDVWEELRSIEQSRNLLLITASQTNRGAVDAKYIKDSSIAEDYSKIAKLDLGIGLCQTDEMKKNGEMNLNKVVYRHDEFVQSHTCMVLQELGNMQAVLDSEFSII